MRRLARTTLLLPLFFIAGCGKEVLTVCCPGSQPSLRVVNAFTSPVDVLIDGTVAIAALGASEIAMTAPGSGSHTLGLRPVGSAAAVSQSITIVSGALGTIAIARATNGDLTSTALDDTNSVVPAGATKLRVLHLAPNAGTLQVYRTQPDFQQPVPWQFPFTYQSTFNSLSAPFYQSTIGSWEVRVWQTPADASGWASAAVKVVIPLGSGEKKTVLILDKPGGGVRIELL